MCSGLAILKLTKTPLIYIVVFHIAVWSFVWSS